MLKSDAALRKEVCVMLKIANFALSVLTFLLVALLVMTRFVLIINEPDDGRVWQEPLVVAGDITHVP
jgi:hypothetical protein